MLGILQTIMSNWARPSLGFIRPKLKIQRSPKKSFRHPFLRSFDQTALTLW